MLSQVSERPAGASRSESGRDDGTAPVLSVTANALMLSEAQSSPTQAFGLSIAVTV